MKHYWKWLAIVIGIYVLIGGLLTLLGWYFDVPRLADWEGDGVAMQPNTAIAAILTAAAILLTATERRRLASGLGVIVLLIGASTLLEHVSGLSLGIDQLLLFDRRWGARNTLAPGRMGMPAAISWTLSGIAIVSFRRPGKSHWSVPIIGPLVMMVSGLSLIGYLFGADTLYTLPRLTAVALQTATILFTVGAALTAIGSDHWPLRALMEDSAAGALARRALPIVVAVPVGMGLLCVRGQSAGLFDASMGIALMVLALTTTLIAVLWWGVSVVGQREASLRQSEERFSRFMQNLPGLAWIKDQNGRYLYVNETAEKVFGLPQSELFGKTDDEIFPKETATQFHENDDRARLDGGGIQVVESLKHKDGVIHHSLVSKFAIKTHQGDPTLIGGIAVDITDRQRAQETVNSLLRISGRLNSTLDVEELLDFLIQDAITLVQAEAGVSGLLEPQGMVCKKYFQKSRILPLEYCWPPMHGLPGWLIVNRVPYLTNDASSDTQIIHELCERFGVSSALSTPIINGRGEVIGFFEVHNKRDGSPFTLTDQEMLVAVSQAAAIAVQNALAYRSIQSAEETLRQSDRRKDEFLALLAHELRNPLAPIRTGLEIIKQQQVAESMREEAQQIMERQVVHLVRLVDDLLDLSRINRDKLELRQQPVNVASVVRHAVEMAEPIASRQSQSIEVILPREEVSLLADPIRLAQVFSNLLNNACKFSPEGSKVVIAAEHIGSDLVVSVKDHGIGIPREHLAEIFEMFAQVHQSFERSWGGLGIGLTLVKRLVEMHGGTITAHSEGTNQGSEFVIHLPALSEKKDTTGSHNRAVARGLDPQKILVVDDNKDAAITLGTLLKHMGHEIVLAFDGVEAVRKAEIHHPRVILLDIGLPQMDGYDACRSIRQTPWGANVVIVALTGWGQNADRRQSSEAGFDGHLVKPVDYDALVEMLADLVAPSRA